jgi:hypothetical protein
LDTQVSINEEAYTELKKRFEQVKVYFNLDDINIIIELVSNNTVCYYCDVAGYQSHFDIIQTNKLEEQLRAGHLSLRRL